MCGIVGIAGQLAGKEEKAFRHMLILDIVRGEDSTGFVSINPTGDVIVGKEAGDPFYLFHSKEWMDMSRRANRVLIGHNRYATVGAVNKKTAHPFDFDEVVGVHNGTLGNKWALIDGCKFDVDSEALYNTINAKGIKDAIDRVKGAWSLVWWNKMESRIHFLRNKERPMYIAWTKDKHNIMWASEPWIIEVAAMKNNIEILPPELTEVDKLYSFDINKDGGIKKPHVGIMESEFKEPVYQGYYQGNNSGGNRVNGSTFQGQSSNVMGGGHVAVNNPYAPQTPKTTVATDFTVKKGGVLSLVKKHDFSPSLIEEYRNRKDVLLEIVAKDRDSNGADYVVLMDNHRPLLPIRLFIHRRDGLRNKIGRFVRADIGAWCSTKKDGNYFKISPLAFNLVEEVKTKSHVVTMPEIKQPTSQFLYNDGKGHKLTAKEWEQKFPTCDWCFNPLFANDPDNRLLSSVSCLCGNCAKDEAATGGIKLTTVF